MYVYQRSVELKEAGQEVVVWIKDHRKIARNEFVDEMVQPEITRRYIYHYHC